MSERPQFPPYIGIQIVHKDSILSGAYLAYDKDGRFIGAGHLAYGFKQYDKDAEIARFDMSTTAYEALKARLGKELSHAD